MRFFNFLIYWLMASLLSAQESLINEFYPDQTGIEIEAPFAMLPSGGFAPVRVRMDNQKGNSDLSWRLDATARVTNYYSYRNRSDANISSSYRLSCPAGQVKVVDLLIPIHQQNGNGNYGRNLRLNLTDPDDPDRRAFGSLDQESPPAASCVAVSASLLPLTVNEFQRVFVNLMSRRSGYGRRNSGQGYGQFSVAKLPEDWRAYAGFDALFMSHDESRSLSPGVSKAIDQWVASGGQLLILAEDGSVLPSYQLEGFGAREVIPCGKGYKDLNLTELGFEEGLLASSQALRASREFSQSDWQTGAALGSVSMHTGLLLFALIIFAILVGPVNLFVWAKGKKRYRLFVTTPLISLGASLILVVIIVAKDGFGGDGARAVAIDVGEPGATSAVVMQEQFSRTGILMSSKLQLDKHSVMNAVSPPLTDYNRSDSSGYTGLLSYSAGKNDEGWEYSGNWFSSRSEQAQMLRSVIPSRARLERVGGTDGAPRLTSSFSYGLADVFYKDQEGEVWTASSIDPGETVTLRPSSSAECRETLEPLLSRFTNSHADKLEKMTRRSNSFSASANAAPAISTHESIDWQGSSALITGRLSN